MAESKPVTIGPFVLGMNNRLPDTDLSKGQEGRYIRDAVNIDIDSTGRLSRRDGVTKIFPGSACHSVWANDDVMFYVDGDTMYSVVNGAQAFVRNGLMLNRKVSYASAHDGIYWSNGVDSGKIVNGISSPWAVPLPTQQPGAAVDNTTGALVPGTYRAYYVFVDSYGQESGSSDVAQATVSAAAPAVLGTAGHRNDDLAGSSITISNLPTTMPDGAASIALYMTGPDGTEFMQVATPTTSSYTVAAMPTYGQGGATLNLLPLPPGAVVREHNARLLVGAGNCVFVSEPYALGLYDPVGGFITFADDVTLIVPIHDGGVFVVADRTYWFPSELLGTDLNAVLPYGGVPGTDVLNRTQTSAWWMSTRGLVLGSKDGTAKNIQEDSLAIETAVTGASMFRELDGLKQTVSSTFGPEVSGAAARSFMSADVIRKGLQ